MLAAGGDDDTIARLLQRRHWARVHEGVYVEHTGGLTAGQREWAATLVHHPSVLAGWSALRAHGLEPGQRTRHRDHPDHREIVELAVDRSRRVVDPPGVRTMQLRHFGRFALLDASPPRLRLEPAALMVASRAPHEDAAVAVLADVDLVCLARSARIT